MIRVWEKVNELKEEGKLPPPPTEEELAEEPMALAFTPYEIEEDLETPEETLISDGLEEVNEIVEEETQEQQPEINVVNQPKTIIFKGRDRNANFTRIDRIS